MLWIIFGLIALSMAYVGYNLHNAPSGWEDSEGFHYGEKP